MCHVYSKNQKHSQNFVKLVTAQKIGSILQINQNIGVRCCFSNVRVMRWIKVYFQIFYASAMCCAYLPLKSFNFFFQRSGNNIICHMRSQKSFKKFICLGPVKLIFTRNFVSVTFVILLANWTGRHDIKKQQSNISGKQNLKIETVKV